MIAFNRNTRSTSIGTTDRLRRNVHVLRRYRKTVDVKPKPTGGNNPRRIDSEWLRAHARSNPDARLIDRIADWETKSRVKVSVGSDKTRLIRVETLARHQLHERGLGKP